MRLGSMLEFCCHFVIRVAENSVGKRATIIFAQINASGSEEGQMAGEISSFVNRGETCRLSKPLLASQG
jgi:hypothetical protein